MVGLSDRLKSDIAEEGREGVRKCTDGTGIMDRLGGLGGWGDDPPYPETEKAGECERPMEMSLSQFPPESKPAPNEIDREVLGPGIRLGVFGRCRGVAEREGVLALAGVCDLDGGLKAVNEGVGRWN